MNKNKDPQTETQETATDNLEVKKKVNIKEKRKNFSGLVLFKIRKFSTLIIAFPKFFYSKIYNTLPSFLKKRTDSMQRPIRLGLFGMFSFFIIVGGLTLMLIAYSYFSLFFAKPENIKYAYHPNVTSSSIFNETVDVNLDEVITITFTKTPDTQAIQEELRNELDENLIVEESEKEKTINIKREGGWEADRQYGLTLLADKFKFLEKDFTLSFKTLETPKVSLTNLDGYINEEQDIYISFNTQVFKENEELSPSMMIIDPPVVGKFEIVTPTTFRFDPEEALLKDTNYKISIPADKVTNIFGLKMKEDFNIDFMPGQQQENPNRSYLNHVYSFISDIQPNSSDPIKVLVVGDIDKNSFKLDTKITKDAGVNVPTNISWSQITYKNALSEFQNVYIHPKPEDDHKLSIASISPKSKWDKGKKYELFIGRTLKNSAAQEMSYDFIRKISVPDDFKYINSDANNGKFTGNGYQKDFRLTFTNEMLYQNEDLQEHIKLTALTGKKGDMNKYMYVGYGNSGNAISIQADLRDGNKYKVSVSPELTDKYGNKLGTPVEVEFEVNGIAPKSLLNIFGKRVSYIDNNDEYRILLESMNLNDIDVQLAKITPEEFIHIEEKSNTAAMNDAFSKGQVVQSWNKHFEKFNEKDDVKYGLLQFQYNLEGIEDGVYVIRTSDKTNTYKDYRLLIFSKNATVIKRTDDKTLAWAVNTDSGEPLSGVQLTLRNGGRKVHATTNEKGLAMFEGTGKGNIHVYSDDGRVFVSNTYDNGLEKYNFINYRYEGNDYDDTINYVYFDRPIYKSDEDVHFKILSRNKENNSLAISKDSKAVEVTDEKGNSIYTGDLQPTEFGTVYDTFHLGKELNSGLYYMNVNGRFVGGFRISAYQVFNYSFSAEVDDKEIYGTNDNVNVKVDANYYFGEALKNAEVEVNLYARENTSSYFNEIVGDEYKYYSFPNKSSYGNDNYSSEKVGTLKATTDENGHAELSVPIDIPNAIAYGTVKTLSVEVKVRDHIGMEEYKTFYKTLTPKDGVIGVHNKSYSVSVKDGHTYNADAVVFNGAYNQSAGNAVKIEVIRKDERQVKRRRSNGVFYWDRVLDEQVVHTETITTNNKGNLSFSYKPEQEATYEVKFSLANNPKVNHKVTFYAYDYKYGGFDYYGYYNADAKSVLKSNKEEYNIGDVANFTPELPHSNYLALVSVERESIIEYDVVNLNEIQNFEVKISANLAPNFYYSFFAFSPHSMGNEFLDFKMGIKEVKVATSSREIKTEVTTDKERYYPKDNVKMNITTSDNKNVEYLVAVVDKAVLDLSKIDHNKDLSKSLSEQFWTDWALSVETASNLTIYENKLAAEKKWGNKGGSGDGGDGGPDLQIEDIRRNFESVALWIPATVGKNGELELEFEVPDNLTTWSIVALGITKDTAVAVGTKEIIVSNDVNIIAGVPSYLTVGDSATLTYNASFSDKIKENKFETKIEVENAQIECKGEMKSECFVEVKKEEFPIEYKFIPKKEGIAKVRFGITQNENILDAEEREIDINSNSLDKHEIGYGDTRENQEFKFAFPSGHSTTEKNLRINLSDNIAGDLSKIKTYFINYSNLCSEQTSSKILTLLPYAEEDEAKGSINKGIQRLYVLQNEDGGWGIWENNGSVHYNTLYAYSTLKTLDSVGYNIDKKRLDKAEKHILDRINNTTEIGDNLPYAYSILSDVNKFDINGTNNYYSSKRTEISLINQAHILNTYKNYLNSDQINNSEREFVQGLIDELNFGIMDQMRVTDSKSYWQNDRGSNSWYYNNNIKTTSVILDVMLDIRGNAQELIPVINYLKYEIANNNSLGTQGNAYAFKALKKAQKVFKLDLEHARVEITVNGEKYKKFEEQDGRFFLDIVLEKDTPTVEIEVTSKNNSLIFYQIDLGYNIPLNYVKAKDKGMSISTEYYSMEDHPIELDENNKEIFHQGAVYKAETTLFIKDDIAQSEVRIPIPAGLKAIDFNLNSTSDTQLDDLENENNENPRFFDHLSINEQDVVFYTGDQVYGSQMKKGVYTFSFYVRANMKGEFVAPGEWLQEMYLPGRGAWQDSRYVKVI